VAKRCRSRSAYLITAAQASYALRIVRYFPEAMSTDKRPQAKDAQEVNDSVGTRAVLPVAETSDDYKPVSYFSLYR
jgi:hypothetical protein